MKFRSPKIKVKILKKDVAYSSTSAFTSSFMFILFLGLAAMLVISLMSSNTTISFKGFMMSLAEIRFRNSWLSSLSEISDAFNKLNSYSPSLPGGFLNVFFIFTSFFEWIFNFGMLMFSIVKGLFNLLMDFIVNISVILKWLVTFGASIS